MNTNFTLSVVSHGQGTLVAGLLQSISARSDCHLFKIILTFNFPESEDFLADYSHLDIFVVRNSVIKGFGANHNQAFSLCNTTHFIVCNPDVRFLDCYLASMLEIASDPVVGVVGPACFDGDGVPQDSVRKFPTPSSLIRRRLMLNRMLDYEWSISSVVSVDWVAGMFMIFDRESYELVGGFDEGYFLYFEDVDICFRLSRLGKKTVWDCRSSIIHDARRSSHRHFKYLLWHLKGAIRFFNKQRRGS